MHKLKSLVAAIACCLASVGPAPAQPMWPTAAPAASSMRPIRLAKMVMKVRRGGVIGLAKGGLFCIPHSELYWDSGRTIPLAVEEFDGVFRDEMSRAGYGLAGNPSNLFEDSSDNSAEYFVGGMITRIDVDLCFPGAGFGNFTNSRGSASIDVEWQIYSALERKVVGTLRTTGAVSKQKGEGEPWSILFKAFAASVRQLAANDRLKTALSTAPVDVSIGRKAPTNLTPLPIAISRIAPSTVADAVASTVLVFASGSEGSGFLISPDGYVLTNHHVVGSSQYVKIRWSDGSEGLGEVVRSDKPRDVALIKTDPKGHKPLRLRDQPVVISEDIYAIGAPAGKQFQSSVTKGIVSATRVFNGFNFIQSDVGVTHGNSGGPIVDAKGQVVGLTDLGFEDAKMVNLFIPVREAQDFLGLQMAQPK